MFAVERSIGIVPAAVIVVFAIGVSMVYRWVSERLLHRRWREIKPDDGHAMTACPEAPLYDQESEPS